MCAINLGKIKCCNKEKGKKIRVQEIRSNLAVISIKKFWVNSQMTIKALIQKIMNYKSYIMSSNQKAQKLSPNMLSGFSLNPSYFKPKDKTDLITVPDEGLKKKKSMTTPKLNPGIVLPPINTFSVSKSFNLSPDFSKDKRAISENKLRPGFEKDLIRNDRTPNKLPKLSKITIEYK